MKKIYLVLFLLLILFYASLKISNYNVIKNIVDDLEIDSDCSLTNKMYSQYRLGDMVTIKDLQDKPNGKGYHLKHFPNSIASEYMKTTNEIGRFDILADIVRKKYNPVSANSDTIVIHLRIGDVINESSKSVEEILTYPTKNDLNKYYNDYYTPTINYIHDQILQLSSITNAILVSGSHMPVNETKSCKYIFTVKEYLEMKNYSVSTRLGSDPDEDFVLMCKCENLISSRGNFAYVINQVRKEFGLRYTDTKNLSFY